ncbi:MAG: tRNA lysidine(34) synthetase TilS [Geminicoccaceae bacterium]
MTQVAPFEHQPVLAIAVSGGPDSLALTLLAAGWAKQRGGRAVGLTVDHGLRASSADEAQQTAAWLAERDIEHHILAWSGKKPETGLQMRARNARYDRLTDWCRQAGILHLLTGHHREDQAETMTLREARKSGPDGLAGIATVRELRGLRLLRPLLGVAKARLRATLLASGQPWIEDPSNDDPRFARSRLRRVHSGPMPDTREMARRGRQRQASDRTTAANLARHVLIDPAGFAQMPRQTFSRLPIDDAAAILQRILMTIGGAPYPPRLARLKRLLVEMRQPLAFKGRTLGHCCIRAWRDSWLFISESEAADHITLTPHTWHRWDRRFVLRLSNPCPEIVVRALGVQGKCSYNSLIEQEKAKKIPGIIRSTLPSLWLNRTLLSVPHLGFFDRSFEPASLDLRFQPRHPLANAPFLPICLAS